MDYVVIGSIGFAQLGNDDFFQKEKIETSVIKEIIKENPEIFSTPDGLSGIVRLKMKSFSHDFGTYKELCVIYDESLIEDSDGLSEEFWDWVNNMECFELETEETIQRCQELFQKEYPMRIIRGGKEKGDNNNLKIV